MAVDAYGEWVNFGEFQPPYYEWGTAPHLITEKISALKVEFSIVGNGAFSSVRSFGWIRTVYYKDESAPLRDLARRIYPKQEVVVFPFSPSVDYDLLGIEILKRFRRYPGSDWLWNVSIYGLKERFTSEITSSAFNNNDLIL
ncbi:MAG: hypothetical protein F6K41_05275 [Symploca sp. SIO3E6]|nr:hypothetical protein [Caldora sp. SIO3E6]